MTIKRKIRYIVLGVLLMLVWTTQLIPVAGECYARSIYPTIALGLSSFSRLFPFAIGDLFIFFSILGVLIYPIYGRIKRQSWKQIFVRDGEYLLWVYVWFYVAWGLNYSQKNFYGRTDIPYAAYTSERFKVFTDTYIQALNRSYVPIHDINKTLIREEAVRGYKQIGDRLGIHQPPYDDPQVKTMLFTPFISMVGVSGSMGPFFCEFTVNGELLPSQYASTYVHEYAHFLGITSEAEANFYAYQVCTQSQIKSIQFDGYLSILSHVLANARRLLTKEEYEELFNTIRPEVIELARSNQRYWKEKYNPFIGDIQDWIYDLYLKGNKIESGRKNYSEVIGLLISYQEWIKRDKN